MEHRQIDRIAEELLAVVPQLHRLMASDARREGAGRASVPQLRLLAELAQHHPDWAYPRRLLAAGTVDHAAPPAPYAVARGRGSLVEPLTHRERDVLRLLATDLDGPGIARELVVSLNTVRTHTKNLYAKLGVTNRRSAITRAHALNLLGRADTD